MKQSFKNIFKNNSVKILIIKNKFFVFNHIIKDKNAEEEKLHYIILLQMIYLATFLLSDHYFVLISDTSRSISVLFADRSSIDILWTINLFGHLITIYLSFNFQILSYLCGADRLRYIGGYLILCHIGNYFLRSSALILTTLLQFSFSLRVFFPFFLKLCIGLDPVCSLAFPNLFQFLLQFVLCPQVAKSSLHGAQHSLKVFMLFNQSFHTGHTIAKYIRVHKRIFRREPSIQILNLPQQLVILQILFIQVLST
ncbi:hypothetical protein BpHYR1_005130 [Brachionus plicatilis]|uniref:Transmembrane protein n=1 Tax=Brachionus plicatilis TaxID=10195 RepID=A0A3M7SP60_BRAPC|nr:hypothetical protein BpHYR1_005130 [Brachionus plicatilis]